MPSKGTQVLQSKSRKAAMGVIDTLQSLGINHHLDIPQIVAVGDRSAGKSSALEALVQTRYMRFAPGDSDCTAFELVLRHTNEHTKDANDTSTVSLTECPGEKQCHPRKCQDKTEIPGEDEMDEITEDAHTRGELEFSADFFRIGVSGPSQPHLTIVDLPGFYSAASGMQSSQDAQMVNKLVQSYLRNPHSIILAIVSGGEDFNIQEVTTITRQVDPLGNRTIGIITKPDTLVRGSVAERHCLELAQNRKVTFRLGWHVLCNRSLRTMSATDEERDRAEDEFFNQGVWSALPASQKGASSLRSRLSEILDDHIRNQLLGIRREINTQLSDCCERLEKLGPPRRCPTEQRKYLIEASRRFTDVVKAAVVGNYDQHNFFRDQTEFSLRGYVHSSLGDFATDMRQRGKADRIVGEEIEPDSREVSRDCYLARVQDTMRCLKGRELPGTFNPLIIGELFREQSYPWRKIATECADHLFTETKENLREVLRPVVGRSVSEKVWDTFINPNLDQLKRDLDEKLDELLRLCESGQAISYNRYVTESVRKKHAGRHEALVRCILSGVYNYGETAESYEETLRKIAEATEPDMETAACHSAMDWAEAYYEVALEQFVDEFSRLAVENCFVMKLPSLFTMEMVNKMDEQTLEQVAGEEHQVAVERAMLDEKQRALEAGLQELGNFLDDTHTH
ncbi:P-loop containing nucleoside triphosphate hydrolase protein [Nemania abortiva]|nr:P-loop containing nucleoside triphosphate hydrolase protein [Nemania abortiva]